MPANASPTAAYAARRWTPSAGAIVDFGGEHFFLSNFAPHPVTLTFESDGDREAIRFPTVEHAFAALKVDRRRGRNDGPHGDAMDLVRAIAACATPGDAKRMGRRVRLRPDWDAFKPVLIKRCLGKKFAPGSELAERLLATGDAELVEGNTWGDRIWGAVRAADDPEVFEGSNILGELLMEIRAELRERAR